MATTSSQFTLVSRAQSIDFNPWKPPNRIEHKRSSSSSSSGKKKMEISSRGRSPSSMLSPPGLGSFKPPNFGFGRARDNQSKSDEETAAMIESLKRGTGSWHARASTIWELQQAGVTSETLYDEALVTPFMQTSMVVAAKVYDSLAVAQASTELLSALESDEKHVGGLYELRVLSNKQRKAAAEYMIEKELDAKGAEELARAIKQHERRSEFREGFSPVPGDCLALMHYRAAKESTQVEERKVLAEQALELAVSETAVGVISKLLQGV